MSNIRFNRLKNITYAFLVCVVAALSIALDSAHAAKGGKNVVFSNSDSDGPSRKAHSTEMMFDLSLNYVRDTSPQGTSDTAPKFSLGGMFNHWLGLDLQGMYQVKSKNFLVGADLRVRPTDWFFMRGGLGGYSHRDSNEFRLTPLVGSGIMARIDHELYFVAEASYFKVSDRNNLGLGVGAGISF